MNNDVKKVPYIVYEAELYRCRKAIKALAVLLAVFFILGILSNLCWKIAFDKATEGENTSESVAALETEVKLRDSNIYTDQKSLELYKYFDGEIKDIRNNLAGQAVMNQKTADSFEMVRNDMICVKNELYTAIARERDERCCGDNAIVTYANATFYPKLVANVTAGTETTAQAVYNPLPNCGKCC